jgi:hypothetical protein
MKLQGAKLQRNVRQAAALPREPGMEVEEGAHLAARLRKGGGFGELDDTAILTRAATFPISRFLDLVAREQGFESWGELVCELETSSPEEEEATELYMLNDSEFGLNVWCPTYEAARDYLDTRKGFYLLQYRGKCFLTQAPHIRGLGLDPNDPDWERIGRDWVKPADQQAKQRLRDKLRAHRETL